VYDIKEPKGFASLAEAGNCFPSNGLTVIDQLVCA